jgi:hypothetical protein
MGSLVKRIARNMRRSWARLQSDSASHRRVLAFERFEPRLALSTTQAVAMTLGSAPLTLSEGGFISSDSILIVVSGNSSGIGRGSSFYDYSPGDAEGSVSFDSTLSLNGVPMLPRSDLEVDGVPLSTSDWSHHQGQIFPISPPTADQSSSGSSNEGGQISLASFNGLQGLGLQQAGDSAALAKAGHGKQPTLEGNLSPTTSAPSESLRARAVVYEVAYSSAGRDVPARLKAPAIGARMAATQTDGDVQQLSIERSLGDRQADIQRDKYVADARAPLAAGDEGGQQAATKELRSAQVADDIVGAPMKLAPAASIPHVATSDEHGAGESTDRAHAAARDAAFSAADLNDDAATHQAPVFADGGENRHRRILGAAVLAALVARPVSKKLRHRNLLGESEQRPRKIAPHIQRLN